MALLTRSRSSSPTEEALDRARDLSEQLREASGEVVERAREATEPRIAKAREAAEPQIVRAKEAAEPQLERAREASRPVLAQVRRAIGTVLRLLVRIAALVPGVGAQVLEVVARGLGSLADRSAELADVDTPSHASRRSRRRRAALWFTGGFAAGAATGYVVAEMNRHEDDAADPRPTAALPDRAPTGSADA
jgi:hypothetical protein